MNNTLTNGLSLLLTIANSGQAHGVTELANLTGLPKSHVHRLLKSLVEAQYLEKDSQSRYKISVGALRLGSELLRNIPIRSVALPIMMKLVHAHKINLTLAMPFGFEAIVVAYVSHTGHSHSSVESLGRQLSPNCSASGKLFLAYKSKSELKTILAQLDYTPRGPHTHLNAKSLSVDLETIRERGYSLNHRESAEDGISFACPIFDQDNQIHAALGISGNHLELPTTRLTELVDILMIATKEISQQLNTQNS